VYCFQIANNIHAGSNPGISWSRSLALHRSQNLLEPGSATTGANSVQVRSTLPSNVGEMLEFHREVLGLHRLGAQDALATGRMRSPMQTPSNSTITLQRNPEAALGKRLHDYAVDPTQPQQLLEVLLAPYDGVETLQPSGMFEKMVFGLEGTQLLPCVLNSTWVDPDQPDTLYVLLTNWSGDTASFEGILNTSWYGAPFDQWASCNVEALRFSVDQNYNGSVVVDHSHNSVPLAGNGDLRLRWGIATTPNPGTGVLTIDSQPLARHTARLLRITPAAP
jgi:hypothetical protein